MTQAVFNNVAKLQLLDKDIQKNDFIFVENKAKDKSRALNMKLKRFFARTEWETLQSHDFRSSFVTNAYLNGVPLLDISKGVGHASIAATQHYVKGAD